MVVFKLIIYHQTIVPGTERKGLFKKILLVLSKSSKLSVVRITQLFSKFHQHVVQNSFFKKRMKRLSTFNVIIIVNGKFNAKNYCKFNAKKKKKKKRFSTGCFVLSLLMLTLEVVFVIT